MSSSKVFEGHTGSGCTAFALNHTYPPPSLFPCILPHSDIAAEAQRSPDFAHLRPELPGTGNFAAQKKTPDFFDEQVNNRCQVRWSAKSARMLGEIQ